MKNQRFKKEISWLIRDKYAGDSAAPGLNEDLLRLKKGEPLDYIIGWKEFLGCKVDLSLRPLIPREETEYWVTGVMKSRIRLGSVKILDIFAGSGCIGVGILKHFPNAEVTFGEINGKLIKQIRQNCEINGIDKKRYRVVQSDVWSKVRGKYDYIFANPPYIPEARKKQLSKGVTDWEPGAALWGGRDGLKYIRLLLRDFQKHLMPTGKLFLEFDHAAKLPLEKLLARSAKILTYKLHRDQFNRFRWAEITAKQGKKKIAFAKI